MTRRCSSARPRKAGYLMVEMVFVLSLMGLLLVVVASAFNIGTRSLYDSADYTQEAARVDAAVHQLRLDIWQARSIAAPSPDQLDVVSLSGDRATWQWHNETRTLTRTLFAATSADNAADPAQSPSTWRDLREPWRFAVEGQTLHLRVGKADAAGQLHLTPQRVLLEGGEP